MSQVPNRSLTLSRRRLVLSGVTSTVMLMAAGASGRSVSGQDLTIATPDELLDTIINQPGDEIAVDALVQVFARSGIVVFEEQGVQPIAPPTAPLSPLAFERWQLRPFVDELAAGRSQAAADYDAMFPVQTETGEVVPTVGELLTGYYGGATTVGADFTRAWLNRFLTANMVISPAELPAPGAIMALLGGEILGQLQEAEGMTVRYDNRHDSSRFPIHKSEPSIMAFSAISITGDSTRLQVGVCGLAQSFINDVVNRIFSTLTTAGAVTGIPLIDDAMVALANGVQIGVNLVIKAINVLLAPVLGVIRSIGAGLAVASMIVGTLTPWTVSVELRPTRNRFGIDAEVVTGEIGVTAGGWDRIPLPEAIRECATVAGIELPKPTAEDAPVHISVSQPMPLLSIDNPELRLDIDGRATATYVTQNETSEQAKGDETISIAWIRLVVDRDDLKKLRDDLFTVLFAQLPDLINQAVRPLVGPTADELTNKLIALATVSGTKPLFVTHHRPKEEPEEPDSPDDGDGGCVPGIYQVVDPAAVQRVYVPMPIEVTGRMLWEFRADGTWVVTYDDLVIAVEIDPAAPAFTYAFSGTQSGVYSTDNGVLTATLTEDNMGVAADMIAIVGEFSGPLSAGMTGTFTCGTSIIWQLQLVDGTIVPFELVPID